MSYIIKISIIFQLYEEYKKKIQCCKPEISKNTKTHFLVYATVKFVTSSLNQLILSCLWSVVEPLFYSSIFMELTKSLFIHLGYLKRIIVWCKNISGKLNIRIYVVHFTVTSRAQLVPYQACSAELFTFLVSLIHSLTGQNPGFSES